jgi:penicillin amidase
VKQLKSRCLASRIRCLAANFVALAVFGCQAIHVVAAPTVELLRDPWGTPHVFAVVEAHGFFGLGYAAAEDRLLQMELIRRRASGRLAEVFGPDWVDADREARIAGHAPYAPRAFAKLPARWQDALRAYSAGVNAWREAHPDAVARRFKPLGIEPESWTPSDCLLAARGILSLGPPFSADPVEDYHRFADLVAQVGEADAERQSGLVIDDSAAIVSEADMAKHAAVYQRLKQRPRMPGLNLRPAGGGEEGRKMSHAWAVSGRRSTTGKPILESDPQLPLSSPPFLYEFHLAAGKIDARGVGVPGCPGLFIGWNRRVAWGVSALGVDSHVVFLDRLTPDGKGYVFEDQPVPFERRLERIEIKGGQSVIQEVLTSRHGTVFNSLVRSPRAGEAYLLYDAQTMDDGASARMMLEVLDAGNWSEFRRALEHYYSPGAHVVYADADGNVGYHTMVHRPLTPRSPRRALEGWTGRDEVRGRIPFDELPHLLNPESGYVSHANNLPVGSWYPYDLGLATGGTGHTNRSLRLQELLEGDRKFSVADFERVIHHDDVNSIVATLLPIARKVVEEDRVSDAVVVSLLEGVKGWDMHEVTAARFPAARGLGNTLTPYRGSGLNDLYGAGSGGVANLARAIGEQFVAQGTTPTNKLIRAYLVNWLRASTNANGRNRNGATASDEWNARLAQGRPDARDAARTITIPYQRTLPLNLPVVDPSLDIVSPPLTCLDTGTIWSQPGNIYSQIVDLAEVDNSRSMIAPGNAEDGPFRTHQVDLWVRGTMHPAPLSRAKVEALGGKAQNLTAVAYSGSLSSSQTTVGETPGEGRFVPAIPPVAVETKSEAKPMPGRKPEDASLEAAFRVILRQGTPPEEVAAKLAECRDYVKGKSGLTDQLRNAALLGEYLIEESAAGRLKVQYGSPYVLGMLKALLTELGRAAPVAPNAAPSP